MADIDLNEAEEAILSVLEEGRNTPSNIARRLDYTREYISQRLRRLTEHGLVERVDRGLYGLPEKERPDETIREPEPQVEPSTEPAENTSTPVGSINELLEQWRPGRNAQERQQRRKVGRAALQWLASDREGSATREEFIDALYADDLNPSEVNEDTWWRNYVRPALQLAREEGMVRFIEGSKDWRWTADQDGSDE